MQTHAVSVYCVQSNENILNVEEAVVGEEIRLPTDHNVSQSVTWSVADASGQFSGL